MSSQAKPDTQLTVRAVLAAAKAEREQHQGTRAAGGRAAEAAASVRPRELAPAASVRAR
jgi:hypothetical protein